MELRKIRFFSIAPVLFIFFISWVSHATSEEMGEISDKSIGNQLDFNMAEALESLTLGVEPLRSIRINPEEAFLRTQSVLGYFGVPQEPDTQKFFEDLQGSLTAEALKKVIPFLDMQGRFPSFSLIERINDNNLKNGPRLRVFQDSNSKKVLDYEVKLAEQAPSLVQSQSHFYDHLKRAAENPADQPLAGLKIALDPGHMGGAPWDEMSGKFVHDTHGHILSEGLMVLQTSLLLEERLKALGAKVFITHRKLEPVTSLSYDHFDLKPYALRNLRENALSPWFNSLLTVAPAGPSLYEAFSKSSDFKKLFGESLRWKYFFLTADLDARVQSISEFAPDLTLIIHMDTSDPPGDPNGMNPGNHNATKAYVPGGFYATEFASRADRKFFGRHLLDAQAWQDSVRLSRRIVDQIHSKLEIPLERTDGGNSVMVEPGILARNLFVQRQITGSATSYLECLYYNGFKEFEELSRQDHWMEIDGKPYAYSERLNTLVDAINEGILEFVKKDH